MRTEARRAGCMDGCGNGSAMIEDDRSAVARSISAVAMAALLYGVLVGLTVVWQVVGNALH